MASIMIGSFGKNMMGVWGSTTLLAI